MLSGIVEVDETSVGGASKYKKGLKNTRGEGTKDASDGRSRALWRGRAAVLPGIKAADFEPLVRDGSRRMRG
jgi:hypothetical protein